MNFLHVISISGGIVEKSCLLRVFKELPSQIDYFKKMFLGGFQEADIGIAKFPEDDVATFSLLLKWVYTGEIPAVLWESDTPVRRKENWFPFKLYALGDKLCLPEVMDRTFDAYTESLDSYGLYPAPMDISDGYSCTPENSPLRAFLCSAYVYLLLRYPEDNTPGSYTNERMHDALVAQPDLARDILPLLRAQSGKEVTDPLDNIPSCHYHTHPAADVCPWKGLIIHRN